MAVAQPNDYLYYAVQTNIYLDCVIFGIESRTSLGIDILAEFNDSDSAVIEQVGMWIEVKGLGDSMIV